MTDREFKRICNRLAKAGEAIVEAQRLLSRVHTPPKKRRTYSRVKPPKPHRSFMDPVHIDQVLSAIVGEGPLTRVEIISRLWTYIRKNGLQNKECKRMINADKKLLLVFGGKKQVSMFEMTKLVGQHTKAK